MDSLVLEQLDDPALSERERAATARLTTFAVEGLLSHPVDAAETRAVLDLVLDQRSSRNEQGPDDSPVKDTSRLQI